MELLLAVICLASLCLNVALYLRTQTKKEVVEKPPFTEDEIDKIKQVVNILSWGGEDEN